MLWLFMYLDVHEQIALKVVVSVIDSVCLFEIRPRVAFLMEKCAF
jgi:hypothetical protein